MEQYMYDDQVIDANMGERPDLTYDNDALDVLTELFDNDDNNISDEILNSQTEKAAPGHTLPDSPPYSGSEAYSPDNHKLLSPSACSEVSSQSSGYHTGQSPDPLRTFQPDMNQQQQLHNHLVQQQQLQQMQQLREQQLLQQHLHQQAALQSGGQLIIPPNVAAMHMQRQHNGPSLPQLVTENQLRAADMRPQPYNSETHSPFTGSKKRKFTSESPPLSESEFLQQQQQLQQLQQVKQEPVVQQPPPSVPSLPVDFDTDACQSMDISPGMLNGGSYQPIKWREFQKTSWCPVINAQGQIVNVQTYRLDGDKGFNFSQIDKAFVCQKKNHFQITSCLSFIEAPQYVMSPEGPKPIESLQMHFYGVKEEAPNQLIQVDQSQADRSKKKFDPVALHPNAENSWKVTIGRLHFSDTTLNNMRKRGKPNPDQRYFLLVVGIYAQCQGKEYPVLQQCSEKLIVRASNPGQFQDSESEPVKWQPGQTPNSVFHSGKVGINTDTPDEALTVAGNVKIMGTIMQPSDRRIKEDITKADTKEQLKNLQALSLYNYRYTEEFATAAGLDDPAAIETGVIAQELEIVIPEAVKTTTDIRLPNGQVIDSLKVVDKNRLFMESLGAVKELCNVTDSLESKITYLERFNQKLKKLKRIGSMRSTTSNDSDLSRVTSISTVSHVTVRRKHRQHRCATMTGSGKGKDAEGGVCSNKFLQILIFVLVFVMVACVGVILAMLLIDKSNENEANMPTADVSSAGSPGPRRKSNDPAESPPDPATITTTVHPGGSGLKDTAQTWLLGDGCADGLAECEWSHCDNQCHNFARINANDLEKKINSNYSGLTVTEPPPPPEAFEILLTTTLPQQDGSVITYLNQPKRTSGHTGRRKRRSIVAENPAEALNISLTRPQNFPIGSDKCLQCERGSFNYTYGVQVSESFPGTNALLQIDYLKDSTKRPWKTIGMCDTPTEPVSYYANKCIDRAANQDQLLNVTPRAYPEPRPISSEDGATFEIEVGKAFKNVVVFRVTNYNVATNKELCERELGQHLVEFRIWFIRVCYGRPIEKEYLMPGLNFKKPSSRDQASTTTAPEPLEGETNLRMVNGKPV